MTLVGSGLRRRRRRLRTASERTIGVKPASSAHPPRMPETWAPGARARATSRSPPVERGRGPPKTSAKDAKRSRPQLFRAARSPRRYWRGGVAPGSAVPESAGGGVGVVLSAGGGVAVVSLGGVAVRVARRRSRLLGRRERVLGRRCSPTAASSKRRPAGARPRSRTKHCDS